MVVFSTWMLLNYSEFTHRPARYEVLNRYSVVLIPVALLKILWDIYIVKYKVPILTINEGSIVIHNILSRDEIIPFSKIDEIKVKQSKICSTVTIKVKKTHFRNVSKRIYEVLFNEDAERFLMNNNVKIKKIIKPVVYLRK